METTFSIIKPNAMKKNVIGKIITQFEDNNLKIIAAKLVHLKKDQCETFYEEHKEKPFFDELVKFMTSAPVLLMALHGNGAVQKNREIMGATNPSEAESGTIRALFGDSMGENAVHGSDSHESAKRELSLFFSEEKFVNI